MEILTGDFNLLRYSVASLNGDGDIARARDEVIDEVQVVGGVEIDGTVGGGVLVAMTIEIDVECDSILCNRCGIIDEIDGWLDVDTIDRRIGCIDHSIEIATISPDVIQFPDLEDAVGRGDLSLVGLLLA